VAERFWRITYADGSTFDSNCGGPEAAPADGILAIRQKLNCETGHHPDEILKRSPVWSQGVGATWLAANMYWWRPDVEQWIEGDFLGFIEQAKHCGAISLKEGRQVDHATFERLWLVISNDPDFA
jgi:hypothetical protein